MGKPLELRINPAPVISRQRITDDHFCLVIDDFLLNPEQAVGWAQAEASSFVELERAYPGVVLPLQARDEQPLHAWVRSKLSREFGFMRGGIETHTQFSLATLQPEQFSWIQQLPHSDPRLEPGRYNFAALLYLFRNPEMGGTGFYRWRDPDFWQELTNRQVNDPNAGLDVLREKFEMFRQPPAYTTESNEAVELLAMVPAKFNRMICYSGDVPHNAFIRHPRLLSKDVGTGRLTLNCFASVWPKPA